MKTRITLLYLSIAILATSCFKDDEPIVARFGKVTTIKNQIEQYQSYYDFESDSVVGFHSSDNWSLGFSCNENNAIITINSGDNWFIFNTDQSDLDASCSYPQNKIWDYDQQKYYPDKQALNKWISVTGNDTSYSGRVYLAGKYNGTGYSKVFRLKMLKVTAEYYVFCYRNELLPELTDTVTIQKLKKKNFIYFSFDDFSVKDLEPEKTSFDIVFGPYYDTVTQIGVTAPYLVRGVLLNQSSSATVITNSDLESVSLGQLTTSNFLERRDIIGYNWKDVVIDQTSGTAVYTVQMNNIYIVKTQEGNYFKFRFVSYTLDGENGYPSFEVEKMN